MTYNGINSYYLVNNIPKTNTYTNIKTSINPIYYNSYNNINEPKIINNNKFYQINKDNNGQIIYSNIIPNNNYISNYHNPNVTINNIPKLYNNNNQLNYIYTINNQNNSNNNIIIDYSTKPNSNEVIQSYQPVIENPQNINTQYDLKKFDINSNESLKGSQYGIINNSKDLYSEFYNDNTNRNTQKLNITKNKLLNIDNNLENQTIVNINSNLPKNYLENQIKAEEINTNQNNINTYAITKKEIAKRNLNSKDYENIHLSGIGMINLGNTCFINSSLQVLIHCKLFIHAFFNKSSLINKQTTPISYQFLLICISILDNDNSKEKYIDISNFKEAFGKKHPIFKGFSQNDSQEFCRVFLEDLSMELNEAKNKDFYKALTNSEGKSKILRDREFDLNFKAREESIITKLFYSQLITTFICQCGCEIYSFQKILDFPLLLPSNINEINIYDLFKINFKAELIDFSSKCERCQKIVKHKKITRISRPPEILIISLQRIDSTTQLKNECLVKFPEYLNLNDFIDPELGFNKESEYKLFSVINHQGIVEAGHYFSYIQPFRSNNWFEFNDSSVRHIKEISNTFPYAYALFYIKKKYLTNKIDINI